MRQQHSGSIGQGQQIVAIETRRSAHLPAPAWDASKISRLLASVLACTTLSGEAAEVQSIHVDQTLKKIVVKGIDLDLAVNVSLGGVTVPTANVTATQLDIPFGSEIYSTIQWEANYNLVIDGGAGVSVYIDAPITGPEPPPPPPPPTGGPDCPCITGWANSGIPKDNFTWCYDGQDGNQLWMHAARQNWTISLAFDSGNLFFDSTNPGNSISYCVLVDDGSYSVAEPVVNIDQYSDCENWMWQKICI